MGYSTGSDAMRLLFGDRSCRPCLSSRRSSTGKLRTLPASIRKDPWAKRPPFIDFSEINWLCFVDFGCCTPPRNEPSSMGSASRRRLVTKNNCSRLGRLTACPIRLRRIRNEANSPCRIRRDGGCRRQSGTEVRMSFTEWFIVLAPIIILGCMLLLAIDRAKRRGIWH